MTLETDILLAFGGLLALIAVLQALSAHLTVPESSMLSAAGVLCGVLFAVLSGHVPQGAESVIKTLLDPPLPAEAYLSIFLPPLLFQAALTIDQHDMQRDAAPILLLAVVAVVVATAMIGVVLALSSPYGLVTCLLLGAVVATTDPAAVIAVFRQVGAPPRLTRLVEGESLLNDAAAIAIVTVLVAMLSGGATHPSLLRGAGHLVWTLAGGMVIGAFAGRVLAELLTMLRGLSLAEGALTLALPYPLYLGGNALHVSGVVAVVCAGVALASRGRTRLSPRNWRHLQLIWEQVAALAGALVFMLAMIRAPTMLAGISWRDAGLLLILALTALAARFVVLFLLLPLLSWLRLSAPVSAAYKTVIAWGGLRGAVTLVLALSIEQSSELPAGPRHFVAMLATGFVLVTLFINGTTLRAVIRRLQLDRLSPQEQVIQRQILMMSMADADDSLASIAKALNISSLVTESVGQEFRQRMGQIVEDLRQPAPLPDQVMLGIALVTLAGRERDLISEYGNGLISTGNLDLLRHNASMMVDGARDEGRLGYIRAARRIMDDQNSYRVGLWLHTHLNWDWLLTHSLVDRFELLICRRAVIARLMRYVDDVLKPIMGERMCAIMTRILQRRSDRASEILNDLRSRFGAYTAALERRLLTLYVLRRELRELDAIFEEQAMSREVYQRLRGGIELSWSRALRRPDLRHPFSEPESGSP
ncbi:cation:proton antiporter [Frateuria aurantia]